MKYKTLFRLALKVIGVCFLGFGLMHVPESVSRFLEFFDPRMSRTPFTIPHLTYLIQALPPLISIAVGTYLFFGGEWIVNKAIPSNRPYCHECGYMLKSLTGNKCPECDTPFRPDPPATPPTTA